MLKKLLKESHLEFFPLFTAKPHVFISARHPLADKRIIAPYELENYPFLAFEQGEFNSFYFSEEILSTAVRKKVIHVSDRATLFNLLIGLNGYTICTGILNSDLNGDNIASVLLETDENMCVGWIKSDRTQLSRFALEYIEELKRLTDKYSCAE